MVKHRGHLSDQTHWLLLGMAISLLARCNMLGFVFVNFSSYILLISLAGTGHSLRCIFGMNNIYRVGILDMADRLEN